MKKEDNSKRSWYMSPRKVKGLKLKELENVFPFMSFDDLCPEDGAELNVNIAKLYTFIRISVFDHILTDEEFRDEGALDFCEGVVNARDKEYTLLYAERELKYITLYLRLRKLVGQENAYLYKEGKGFYKFDAFAPYYTRIVDHIRETSNQLERFCFPTLGMFITPGWYFDHHMTVNTFLYNQHIVEEIINDCGLHLLK